MKLNTLCKLKCCCRSGVIDLSPAPTQTEEDAVAHSLNPCQVPHASSAVGPKSTNEKTNRKDRELKRDGGRFSHDCLFYCTTHDSFKWREWRFPPKNHFPGVLSGFVVDNAVINSVFVSVSALFVPGWDFIYTKEGWEDPTPQKTIKLQIKGGQHQQTAAPTNRSANIMVIIIHSHYCRDIQYDKNTNRYISFGLKQKRWKNLNLWSEPKCI